MIFEYDVFLSFSSKDEEIVRPIWQELSLSGLRVFWSDETLKNNAGQSFFKVIQSSLEKSQHLILICTEDALSSKWVQLEYETFFSNYHLKHEHYRRLILLPQKGFDLSSLPPFLRNIQIASSVSEAIPLVGGVDIRGLVRENEGLKKELEIAQIRISQLQNSTSDSRNFDSERTELLARMGGLEKELSASSRREDVLKEALLGAKNNVDILQSKVDRLTELTASSQRINTTRSSFYEQNKNAFRSVIYGLLLVNLLSAAAGGENTELTNFLGLAFMVVFLVSIGVVIRHLIRISDRNKN